MKTFKWIWIFFQFLILIESCKNNLADITPTPTVPNSPSNLTASTISSSKITLNWQDNSSNESGFKIERKVGSGNYLIVGTVGPNSQNFTDTALNSNTTYSYEVFAFNNLGLSSHSTNEATATTKSNVLDSLKIGLIGYYLFKGDAADSSGFGNNGQVTKASLTSDRFGNANSAFLFSSSGYSRGILSQGIYLPYQKQYNVAEISISVWIQPNSFNWSGCSGGCQACILNRFQNGYSNPNGQSWGVYLFSEGNGTQGVFGDLNGPDGNGTTTSLTTTSQTFLNNWHNIVTTYNGASINVYIDGILTNVQPYTLAMNTLGNSGISIGVSNQANGYWDPYDGKIDDIRIYNRALTLSEIYYLAKH